jgi:hypothetical protein
MMKTSGSRRDTSAGVKLRLLGHQVTDAVKRCECQGRKAHEGHRYMEEEDLCDNSNLLETAMPR